MAPVYMNTTFIYQIRSLYLVYMFTIWLNSVINSDMKEILILMKFFCLKWILKTAYLQKHKEQVFKIF